MQNAAPSDSRSSEILAENLGYNHINQEARVGGNWDFILLTCRGYEVKK